MMLAARVMIAAVALAAPLGPAWADPIAVKVGVGTGGADHLYVAQEHGYFAAEGLSIEFVTFGAAEPIAVAIAAGSIDFGATGLSGALYSLAGQGVIKVIAGSTHEAPGFRFLTFVVSRQAWAAGWTSFKDLAGHSVAVPQIGSPSHYATALIAEKYAVDMRRVRVLPLQSVPNVITAATGGQADAGVVPALPLIASIDRGDVKLMGYIGDETPWQIQAIFTSAKIAAGHRDIVERFLRAYRKGSKDLHDAFTAADGTRRDGPTAPAIEAIIAKYAGQTVPQVQASIPYVDAEGRLDVKDVAHQIAWYKSQNMVKGAVDADAVIDQRYVVKLPER
jgi:NitT/TauT family transport system substrate-binding protein